MGARGPHVVQMVLQIHRGLRSRSLARWRPFSSAFPALSEVQTTSAAAGVSLGPDGRPVLVSLDSLQLSLSSGALCTAARATFCVLSAPVWDRRCFPLWDLN